MSTSLPFTGERFVPGAPEAKGEMWYEHWHRYHFLLPVVAGRRVLDVACGDGYGSALLRRTAAAVHGVDISAEAIGHARRTYTTDAQLEFTEASCTALPLADGSVDVVVSFETIEHIDAQAAFLDEVRRVLSPEGLFVVSSPNKAEYSDKRGFANEFHVRELYRDELEALLVPRFAHRRWLGQRNLFASVISAETPAGAATAEALVMSQANPADAATQAPPLYYLVCATNHAPTLAALPDRLSLFTDAEQWAYNDYRDTYKGFQHYLQRTHELEAANAALRAELDALRNSKPAPTPVIDESWLARLIRRLSA